MEQSLTKIRSFQGQRLLQIGIAGGTSLGGGFTGSINGGVAFPVRKSKFLITAGYAVYNFNNGATNVHSNIKMFNTTAGLKI